jgi:hypothetical protein
MQTLNMHIIIFFLLAGLLESCQSYMIPLRSNVFGRISTTRARAPLSSSQKVFRSNDVSVRMGSETGVSTSKDLQGVSRSYTRLSIFSWWCQIILSVVSGVILTFAQSVRKSAPGTPVSFLSSGFALSSAGVGIAFINALWTWTITRAARRAFTGKMDSAKIVPTLRRYSRISINISLLGMFLSLLGAEQIVGTLASKVLSSQGYVPVVAAGVSAGVSQVQALDIFLVQANTNALVAHFVPLLTFLYGQRKME